MSTNSQGHQPASSPDRLNEVFGIDYRSLALFRLSVAGVLIYNLLTRAQDISSIYVDDAAVPFNVVRQFYGDAWCFSLNLLNGSFGYQLALFIVGAIAAVAMALGFWTRAATVVSWLIVVSLNYRALVITTGGDELLSMLLFWAMFLPLGEKWSVDAARRSRATRSGRELSPATVGILLQMCWMYFSTGLFKLNDVWLGGTAMEKALADDFIVRPFGQFLAGYPAVLPVFGWSVLALELIGPVLLLWPWRNRLVRGAALIAFVALHLGIEMSMTVIIFSYVSLAGLTLFIPEAWWSVVPLRNLALRLDAVESRSAQATTGRRRSQTAVSPLGRALFYVQIFFLFYIPLFNITARVNYARPTPGLAAFNRLGEAIGAAQVWNMFINPPGQQRFVGRAELASGETRDILRDRPIDRLERPKDRTVFPSERWMLLVRHSASDFFEVHRLPIAEFLCRQWNERHQADQQVLDFDLIFFPSEGAASTEGKLLVGVEATP